MFKEQRQVDIQSFINQFSLYTIQGRIFLLAMLSLFLVLTFSVIVFMQNQQTYQISRNVEHLEIPLALAASSLSSGLDKVTASQEGYIMSGEESFRIERMEVWEKEIATALEILKTLSQESNSSADREKVKEIEVLLKEFQIAQDKIDKYFLDNRRAFNYEGINTDSINSIAIEMLAQYNQDRRTQKRMVEMLGNEATPVRQKIANSIKPLIENQQDLLKKEVNFIQENIGNTNTSIIIIGLVSLVLLGGISFSLINTVRQSIVKPVKMLNQLALGRLDMQISPTKDELNAVIQAGVQLSENLKNASDFAINIGKGNFDSTFYPSSKYDVLGNSLIQMREQLRTASFEEKKRTWAVDGMAKFVAIMQGDKTSFVATMDKIMSTLINYLRVNQGGIFMLNDTNPLDMYLGMIACYAYNRKRFIAKKISIKNKRAEGLVGQAYTERRTIYLTEIPKDYTAITSGLGEATPTSLLIVPLKLNEQIVGVIELAAFKEFEQYEIEFVEKLSETIASTIITTQAAEQTQELLRESQIKSDILQSKEDTLEALINNTSDIIFVINKDYQLLLGNNNYRKSVQERGYEIRDKMNVLEVVAAENKVVLTSYYQRGLAGEVFLVEEKFALKDEEVYYEISYNPIRNERGEVTGVSVFARNVTERRLQEEKFKNLIEQEKVRANNQIESQKRILAKSTDLFEEKEKKLLEKIAQLEFLQ